MNFSTADGLPTHSRNKCSAGLLGNLLLLAVFTGVLLNIAFLCLMFWGPDGNRLENSSLDLLRKNRQDLRGIAMLQLCLLWERSIFGNNDQRVAKTLELQAGAALSRGKYSEYEEALKQAIDIEKLNMGLAQKDPDTAAVRILGREYYYSLLSLSQWYQSQGRWQDSARLLKEVTDSAALCPPTHAQFVSLVTQIKSLNQQPSFEQFQLVMRAAPENDWRTEKLQFSRLVESSLTGLSPLHSEYKANTNVQGFLTGTSNFLFESGRYDQSAQDLADIVAMGRHLPARSYFDTVSLDRLAAIYALEKRFDQSEIAYRAALARLAKEHSPRQAIYTAVLLRAFSELLSNSGREQEAQQLKAQAAQLLDARS